MCGEYETPSALQGDKESASSEDSVPRCPLESGFEIKNVAQSPKVIPKPIILSEKERMHNKLTSDLSAMQNKYEEAMKFIDHQQEIMVNTSNQNLELQDKTECLHQEINQYKNTISEQN